MRRTIILFVVVSGLHVAIPAQAQIHAARTNLAANPGFEEPAKAEEGAAPAGWVLFSSRVPQMGITRATKRSGEQCLRKREAPKGAVEAVFGIHLSEGKDGATGSVLVDDVMI